MISLKKVTILDDLVHNEKYLFKYDDMTIIGMFEDTALNVFGKYSNHDYTITTTTGRKYGLDIKELEKFISEYDVYRVIIDEESL